MFLLCFDTLRQILAQCCGIVPEQGQKLRLVLFRHCVHGLLFRRHDPADLLVNQVAAREAAALEEAPEEHEILDTAERRTDEQEETDNGSEN